MRSLFCCTLKNDEGVSAIEFAFISPVMLTIMIGIFQFGIAMNHYLNLTNAVAQGALTLALSRGTTTPYTTMKSAINSAAPSLTAGANHDNRQDQWHRLHRRCHLLGNAGRGPAGVRDGDLSLQSDGHGRQLRAERLHLERADIPDDSISKEDIDYETLALLRSAGHSRPLARQGAAPPPYCSASWLVGLMGTAGLTFDVGQVFVSKKEFNAATQAAAMAGANALLANNASLTTVTAAVTAWNTANPPVKVAITSTNVAVSCNTATANLPTCNGTTSNVAQGDADGKGYDAFPQGVRFPLAHAHLDRVGGQGGRLGDTLERDVRARRHGVHERHGQRLHGGARHRPADQVPVRDVFDPERAEEDADLDGQGWPDDLSRPGHAIQSDVAPVPDPAGHDAVLHAPTSNIRSAPPST